MMLLTLYLAMTCKYKTDFDLTFVTIDMSVIFTCHLFNRIL